MKKQLWLLLALVISVTMWAAPAWAATYPVSVDGRYIADAAVKGGITWLPLRTVVEQFGVEVEWQPETRRILLHHSDGQMLAMQCGSNEVHDLSGNFVFWLNENETPYARGGVTYVPLRFMASYLGCGVEWRPAEKRVEITTSPLLPVAGVDWQLNPRTGELLSGDKVLCKLAGDYYYGGTLKATKTPGGNYILQSDEYVSGAFSFNLRHLVWLNGQTYQAYSVEDAPYFVASAEPFWLGGKVWLAGDNQAYLIDDAQGVLLKAYDLKSYIADYKEDEKALFVWADDDHALLRGDNSLWWGLLDLRTDKLTRIDGELLTPEVKARVNQLLWSFWHEGDSPLETSSTVNWDFYWSNLTNRWNYPPEHLSIEFVGATAGQLNFRVGVYNYADALNTFTLSYKYK